jgi:hypothetical protein
MAWASQRWIESPPMRAVPAVVSTLRALVARVRAPRPATPAKTPARVA